MLKKILSLFVIFFTLNTCSYSAEDFSLYLKQLKLDLDRAWNAPVYNKYYTSDVYFKINKDGTLSDVKLYKTSRIPNLDKKAVAAIKDMQQADSLPTTYTSDYIEVVAGLTCYVKKDLRNPDIKEKNKHKTQISELPLSTRFVKIKKVIYGEPFTATSNYSENMKTLELNLNIQNAKRH